MLCSFLVSAQSKEGNNWVFGNHAGVTFNSGSPVSFNGGATNGNNNLEGTATISDSSGNLLFYTDGQSIWNKNHQVMATGLNGHYSATQSGVIVPHPTSPDTFYVFTVDAANNSLADGIQYSIVDMTLNGGLGGIPSGGKNINITPSGVKIAEKITAVRHCNNVDIWVIAHGFSQTASQDYGEKFYAWQVTPNGVQSTPVVSKTGTKHIGGDFRRSGIYYGNARGYMKASPDGRRIALAITYDGCTSYNANFCSSTSGAFEVFDFDYTSGTVSNPIRLKNKYKGAYGVEFSPNGNLLYGSTWASYGGDNKLYQWDLTAGNQTAINNSVKVIANEFTSYGNFGALQLASDGKLYAVRANKNYLSAIQYPNKKGSASGYKQQAVSLGSNTGRFGLPTFVQSYFDPNLGYTYSGQYEDMITMFYIEDSIRIDSVKWKFNDSNSTSSATSSLYSPSFKFSGIGTYHVQLIIWKCNIVDTIEHNIIIYPRPNTGFTINDSSQCIGYNSFKFTDTSTIESGSVTYWKWDFGDGDTSNLQSPTHVYANEGTYTVKLVTTSDHNGMDSLTKQVVVISTPSAGIGVFDSVQCVDSNLFFIDNYTTIGNNSSLSYYWEFGNGDTSTAAFLPPKRYTSVDSFIVKLVVSSDSGCYDTATQLLVTCPMPDAGFTINDSIQCFNGHQFNFTDTSHILWGTYNSYWNFGDSDTSTQTNPTHTYTTSDTFEIEMLLISNHGCRDSAYHKVYVDPSPATNFGVNADTQCFAAHNFKFYDSTSIDFGSFSWNWDFNDSNFSSLQNPTHTYSVADTYYVKLVATSYKNCQDSFTKKIDLFPSPVVAFTIDDTIQCLNENLFQLTNLTTLDYGSNIYTWDFDDGNTSTLQDTSHVYDSANSYTIKLKAESNLGCTDSVSHEVTVHPSPILHINMEKVTLCAGSPVQINLTGADSFHWLVNTGILNASSDSDSVTVSPPNTLTYQIEGENLYTCTDTVSSQIRVFPLPNIDAGQDKAICLGDSAQLHGSGGLIYKWTPATGLNNDSIANPVARPQKTTTYYLLAKNPVGELIPNGDFSMGDTLFSSSYTESSNLYPEGRYKIGTNPKTYHSNFSSCGDYNTGSGNMMIINGATVQNEVVWEHTIEVTKNTEYAFSTFVTSVHPSNPAQLRFSINGTQVGDIFSPTTNTCQWDQFFVTWYSDTITSVTISIVNKNTIAGGNDFALDGLSFSPLCGNTDSVTVLVNPKPNAAYTVNDSSQCYNNHSFVLTNTTAIDSGHLNYLWVFGNGDSTTTTSPVKSFITDDTFSVKLISWSDSMCYDTGYGNLYVFPNPSMDIAVNDTHQCFNNNSFSFINNSSINSGLQTFNWDFGDGNTSALDTPDHSYLSDDTFTVRVIATSDLGCQDSASLITYVHPNPVVNFTVNDTTQCFNTHEFQFTNYTTINSGSKYYSWTFGDGFGIAVANPSHKYATEDTFEVQLVASSGLGCTDTMTQTVYVFPNPVSSIGVSDSQQCFNSNLFTFDNQSSISKGSQTYLWDFGDGNTSISSKPTHSYGYDDTFTVKMISNSDVGCKDSASLSVYVFPNPIVDFSINDSTQCYNGHQFRFTNLTTINSGTKDYSWTMGDGFGTSLAHPVYSYSYEDTFTVKLVATSDLLCKDSIEKNVYVFPNPHSNFSIDDSVQCFNGHLFSFTNQSSILSGSESYTWYFGDSSTSISGNPTHTYTYDDTFNIKLVNTSDLGCTDSSTSIVYLFPSPEAVFSFSDSSQCLYNNQYIFYNGSSINSGSFSNSWFFGDGDTTSDYSPTHSYSSDSIYQVKLTITSALGCSDSVTHKTYVRPMPEAKFATNDTTQCLRFNFFDFTNKSRINSGTIDYQWRFGQGDSSISTNPSISYTYHDTFDIWLKATSNYNCLDSTRQTVYVYPMPKAGFTIDSAKQCIRYNQFSFTDTSKIDWGQLNTNWDFGDGSSDTLINPKHTYSSYDSFDVVLISMSDFGCSDTATKQVEIYPMPKSDFSINDTSQCLRGNTFGFTNKASIAYGSLQYAWIFDDGDTVNSTNTSHSYAYFDTFDVKLISTSLQNCTDTFSQTVYVQPMPLADFIISDSTQCFNGNTFDLMNTSYLHHGNISYTWDLNDGTTSQDTDIYSYSYLSDDTFQVQLLAVSDQNCRDSVTKGIYVYPSPIANYALTDTSQCFERNAFGFVNKTSIHWGSMTYSWYFGDGDTSTLSDPIHSYGYPDTFDIKLVASSVMGCKDSIHGKAYVHVHPEPVARFYVPDSAQCLFGNNFIFRDTSTITSGTLSFIWDFGDGQSSGQQHSSNIYSSDDTFSVKLKTISDWGCIDSIIKQVIVYPMPKANFNINDSDQCLSANRFTFTDSSTIKWGNLSQYWNFGDSKQDSGASVEHSYKNHDTIRVQLISISDMACADTNYRSIIVFPMPEAGFYPDTPVQCVRYNRFKLSDTSSIASGSISWAWSFGDDSTSVLQNPEHSYASFDSFRVKLIATSTHGCSDSAFTTLVTHPMPLSSFDISDSQQCLNENLFDFYNKSSIAYGYNTYQWVFGDNDSTFTTNSTHKYVADDTFNVQLIAKSNNNCFDTFSRKTYVFPSPLALFSVNQNNQCFDSNRFGFINQTTINSGTLGYSWSFGDGSSSTKPEPVHRYQSEDTFLVQLISLSALGCADTTTRSVAVWPSPDALFGINDSTQCLLDNKFIFSNESKISSGDLTHGWYLSDGYSSSKKDINYSFKTYDTFDVKLVVKSNLNCFDSLTRKVVVHPMPDAKILIKDSLQCLSGNLFEYQNLSSIPYGNLNYTWEFGDGIQSTIESPTHSYATYKSYNIRLLASSDHQCFDTATSRVEVFPMPVATFDLNDTSMCLRGNRFSFTNNSTIPYGNLNYKWYFDDGDSSGKISPQYSYKAFGDYSPLLIVRSDADCYDSFSRDLYVRPMPVAAFSVNDSTQCLEGNNFEFLNESDVAYGNLSYHWILGDGDSSINEDVIHTYGADGTYTVTLISLSDEYNCPDTISKPMQVHPLPVAAFSHYTPCLDDTIRFTDQSTINAPDQIDNWFWSFGDGYTSPNQNPLHIFTNAGNFNTSLRVISDKGCRDSISKKLTFYDHAEAPELDRVTVKDNALLHLDWLPSPIGRPKNFVLEKSLNGISFSTLKSFPASEKSYDDLNVDVMSQSYIYRIYTVDSCNYTSSYSNIAKSILLQVDEESKEYPEPYWTKYQNWSAGVDHYDLNVWNANIRKNELISSLTPFDTNFLDNRTQINQTNYCYTITAFRSGDNRESVSNTVCAATPFNIQIPNAFTPNGDGLNDSLEIIGTHILSFELKIFNRWGQKLFETNDITEKWDGYYKGELCPAGVYYLYIDARGTMYQRKRHKGSVTLLR